MAANNVYETAREHLLEARGKWGQEDNEGAERAVAKTRSVLVEAGYSKVVETLGPGDSASVHRTLIELFTRCRYHWDVE